MKDLKENDKRYIVNMYGRFDMAVDHASGAQVFDTEGKRYIDMTSGIGVVSLGYSDPGWVSAVTEQLGKYQHISNLYYSEPGIDLAEKLVKKSGMSKVLFVNSGAEANESAFKIARKYGNIEGRNAVISLKDSFHGRTIAAITATGQDRFHKDFDPFAPGFYYAEPGSIEDLEELADEVKPCALIMELVQGEGGVIPLTEDFVKAIDQIAKEEDIPLIVDEVQTGNGRTGAFYSYMHFGLQPDIVSTAKGLAGGLPIGATLLGEKVENIFGPGDNGSTFGGNPVSCAAAVSVVERIDEALLEEVKEKSKYIFETLQGAKGIESVSGMGLMIGIKTEKPAAEVLKGCMENGVLCLTAKDKVRLLPALNIPMDVLKKAVAVIKEEAGKE